MITYENEDYRIVFFNRIKTPREQFSKINLNKFDTN